MKVVSPAVLLGLLVAGLAHGQSKVPEPLRNVGIDQLLNQQVPLDLKFRDEGGREVALREYFRGKPVVLSLVYYHCPMLCTLTLDGLVRSLRATPLNVNDDFDILTVSFDPSEKPPLAAESKAKILERYTASGRGPRLALSHRRPGFHRCSGPLGWLPVRP